MRKGQLLKFHISLIVFTILIISDLRAQVTEVLVQNNPKNGKSGYSVQLKWYSQSIVYPEGVHVYRREKGETSWTKLTDRPIVLKEEIDSEALANDPDLEFYTELVKEEGVELSEGLLLLNIVIKTFESTPFADFMGVYFEDSQVAMGIEYTYRVQQIIGGRETLLGQSEPIVVGDFVPELAVRDFDVVQVKNFMEFDWAIEEDRFYAVNLYGYASDSLGEFRLNKKPIVITEIETDSGTVYPSPKYRLVDLKEEVEYTYQVAGLDFFGNELIRSNPVTVAFNDVTPPLPPTELSGKLDTMMVSLTWKKPDDSQVKHMTLFRSSSSEGPFRPLFTTQTATFFVDSLDLAGPYYYYVSSFDFSGNEAQSRRVLMEVPDQYPPSKPIGVKVVSDTGRFHLSWDLNPEGDLMGYLVFRTAEASNDHFVLLNADPIDATNFTYKLPKNVKNEFSFFIIALDSAENRSLPSELVAARMPDVTPPEKPYFDKVSFEGDHVVLTWKPNVDADLAGYHVLRSDSVPSPQFERVNRSIIPNDITRYTDRFLEEKRYYIYRVVAVDDYGNFSDPSENRVVYVESKEDGIDEKEIKLTFRYRKKKKENVLSWSTQDSDWLGFMVYRGIQENRLTPHTGLIKETIFTDKKLSSDKYIYQIRGFSPDGQVVKSQLQVWEK